MVEAPIHAVIDNGTGYMKAGFSGEEAPKAVFPTLIGTPNKGALFGSITKERLIGQEALEKMAIQQLNYPIKKGEIVDWSDMEKIWHHTFYNELRIAPEQHIVLLTDPPLVKDENREKMSQIMFENFAVPGLFTSTSSVLAMYATGKTTGMMIDTGEAMTYFVPVYDGYAFTSFINKVELGGADLTSYLIRLLIKKNITADTLARLVLINDMKEKLCYISYDFDTEIKESNQGKKETLYNLPDGLSINLEYEKYRCPELIFKPSFDGKKFPGIHEMCYQTIDNSDPEIKNDLLSNIVLAGGNSLFRGFPERLNKEITKVAPSSLVSKLKIIALPERKYATWIGGSILSSLSNFQYMWITKGEYDEVGSQIVLKKCF